ncbi:MAG: DNA translocase FtsK 4TM domain-containing protein [Clostridia bacterium]
MAKRKSSKKGRKTTKKTASNIDLAVVALIVISILLGVLIYTKSGVIGVKLNEILGGMMGIIKYVLPIGIFAMAIKMAINDDEYLSSKLAQCAILLISFAVLMCVYQVNVGNLTIDKSLSEVVKDSYALGTQEKGGGALGAILAVPLVKLLGPIGAIILCVGVVIILAVFVFGINASEIINNFIEKSQENREERLEQRQKNREEQLKMKQEMLEEKRRAKEQARQEALADNSVGEQIKINFGGRLIDEENTGRKKYNHDNDDLTPLTKETKKQKMQEIKENNQPDVIENNLFKQEEQKKEDKTKEVLQLEHAMVVEDENYEYPPIELLGKPAKKALKGGAKALTDTATKLQKTLYSFGVSAKVENVSVGPAITRYELKPAEGVRVSKIANLADDIALNLAAETIRIEAPIPGKQAVGIEVPNKEKEAVHLREVLESEEFQNNKSKLTVALGKDVAGNIQLADIAKMPHVLIAGSTGSGKSVCINTIISSIIYNAKPSEVKLVMVDPKVVELSVYNGIPHLLIPVVTDPKKAAGALAWAVQEMDDRYNKFAQKGVRDLKGYNKAIEKEEGVGKLPQIVIIVDELADLMMVAAKDVEEAICRLAQKARAAGMHLVIATQRPSVDVITGLIKANIPSRIAFAVSSQVDSRTILDSVGAEKLLGKGDMLFFPSGAPKPLRVQGAFVSDEEVEKIVDFVKQNGTATYSEDILESIEKNNKTDKEIAQEADEDDETDPFLMDAIETVVETGQASTSFIQRRFKVGYARAGRIIDQMEERGIISGYQGSKPREVLMSKERLEELKMGTNTSLPEESE